MTDDKDKGRLEEQIDANLKKVFQDTLDEQIPDKFMDLLAKLKESDTEGTAHGE